MPTKNSQTMRQMIQIINDKIERQGEKLDAIVESVAELKTRIALLPCDERGKAIEANTKFRWQVIAVAFTISFIVSIVFGAIRKVI